MKISFYLKLILFFGVVALISAAVAFFFGEIGFPSLPVAVSTEGEESFDTVIIDAGHGGEDGGASSAQGLVEKDVNLDIAKKLCEMLEASGVKVVMTRTDDRLLYDRNVDFHGRKKKLDLEARLNIAERYENAIFVSIHMNSFSSPKYSGLQVWYSPNHASSSKLADTIQSNAQKLLQPENTRKTKSATSSIYLLDRATCPAVLVECGFLSNAEEAERFENDEYRQKIAFVIFCSIMEHLETAQKEN